MPIVRIEAGGVGASGGHTYDQGRDLSVRGFWGEVTLSEYRTTIFQRFRQQTKGIPLSNSLPG